MVRLFFCLFFVHKLNTNQILFNMRLSDLSKNQMAIIENIAVDKNTLTRLENLGVTVGSKIKLIRIAPLGDPLEIKIRDFYLAIRLSDAKKITVRIYE